MVNIIGTIGFSFTGKLGIKLNGTIIDSTTTPDTVYLKNYERFFNITSGVITSASFPETETSGVSAHISIYELDDQDPPQIILPAFYEFDAIIPSQVSVEFSQLIPTGVVNQQLDTSALRIAKLIANDPALAQKVAGAPYPRGAYDSGETYLYGEMVSYFGKNYISKSLSPLTGVLPTVTASWYELVITLPPEVSVIATGSDTAYGTGWNGSLLVPTQNSVYDKIVNIDSAIATANTNITNLTTNKADLSYVNAQLASDQSELDALTSGKADLSYVNSNLAAKADTTTVNTQLAAKADTTTVNTQLATKADVTTVQQLCRPAFAVTSLTDQTSSSDSFIVMAQQNLNAGANWINNDSFVVPVTGVYLFGGGVYLINLDVSQRALGVFISLNGVDARRLGEVSLSPSQGIFIPLASTLLGTITASTQVSLAVRTFGQTFNYRISAALTNFWGFRVPT